MARGTQGACSCRHLAASILAALCLSRISSCHPFPSSNPLQPRPFRLEGPTPLPATSAGPPSPHPAPSHAPTPHPATFSPSGPSASTNRPFLPLAPSAPHKPSRPSLLGKPSNHRRAPPPASSRPAAQQRASKARDQQGAASEKRGAALRSPLALKLLQEAYVHSAAQEAMASAPVGDGLHPRPFFRQHHPPAPPSAPYAAPFEGGRPDKPRALAIPSPEAARLLAAAVNHNLLAEQPRPAAHRPIFVTEVPVANRHPPHLQAAAGGELELQPDRESLKLHQQQTYVLQNEENVHSFPVSQNFHLQPDSQHQELQLNGQHIQQVQVQHLSQEIDAQEEHQHQQVQHIQLQPQVQYQQIEEQRAHRQQNHNQHQEVAEHQDLGDEEHDPDEPHDTRYDYTYRVRDVGGNNFGHTEKRSGERTWGQYFVHLPDGRLKTVRYWADDSGYHAEVEYEGSANHPPHDAHSR